MKKLVVLLGAGLALPQMALAHVGDHGGSALLAGLSHPIGGADHVLAMVAIGLWAAVAGGRAVWALPGGFVGAILAGGAMGAFDMTLPGVEPMILASIVLIGALVALARPMPLAVMMALVTCFGLFHGHAHGAEGPASGVWAYAAGFAASTLALHGAGLTLGAALQALSARFALRALGGASAVAGLVLAVA
jgi:urease accessory protein